MTDHEHEEAPDEGVADEVPAGGPRAALVTAVVVGVLVALLVGVLATRDSSGERSTQSPLLGRLAPATEGTTLDGGTFDLADHRGRWVLVNFFAAWCIPCRTEHPELVAFEAEHAATGDVTVVSVIFDDEADRVRAFFDRHGGDWPVVTDANGRVAVDWGVPRVPESFLVAPDGTVVQRLIGGVTAEQLNGLLDAYETPAAEARP